MVGKPDCRAIAGRDLAAAASWNGGVGRKGLVLAAAADKRAAGCGSPRRCLFGQGRQAWHRFIACCGDGGRIGITQAARASLRLSRQPRPLESLLRADCTA